MDGGSMSRLESLPLEIRRLILSFLPPDDLWNCLGVSKILRETANDDILWRPHCAIEEIPYERESSVPGPCRRDLSKAAGCWGVWRWGGCHNWKYNKYQEVQVDGLFNVRHDVFGSYRTRLCIFTKGEHKITILTKKSKRSFDVPCDLKVRELQMNTKFIFVLLLNGSVLTYKEEESKFVFYCSLLYLTQGLKIIKELPQEDEVSQDCGLDYIGTVDDQLWLGIADKANDLVKSFHINLSTCQFQAMTFALNTHFNVTEAHFIAYTDSIDEMLVNVYRLSGENVLKLSLSDIDYLLTNRNLIITFEFFHSVKSRLEAYDIVSGKKTLTVPEYLGMATCVLCYEPDILYDIVKKDIPGNNDVIVEALCLKTGNVLWSCPLPFNGCSTRLFLDRYLLIYGDLDNRTCHLIDVNTGILLREIASDWGTLIFISDHFWVKKSSDNKYAIQIF